MIGGWSEKIAGQGEDAQPIVMATPTLDRALVAVADGLGGAGARTVITPSGEATAARVASGSTLLETAAWWAETHHDDRVDLLDLKRSIAGRLRVQLTRQEESGGRGPRARE